MRDRAGQRTDTIITSGLCPPAATVNPPPTCHFRSNSAKATLIQPVTEPHVPVMNIAPMSDHALTTRESTSATRLRASRGLQLSARPHEPLSGRLPLPKSPAPIGEIAARRTTARASSDLRGLEYRPRLQSWTNALVAICRNTLSAPEKLERNP